METGDDAGGKGKAWVGKRVLLSPGSGWDRRVEGPEGKGFGIRGGVVGVKGQGGDGNGGVDVRGTAVTEMLVEVGDVEEAPHHLGAVENAALPLVGVTAWRALVTKIGKGNLGEDRRVLITGIGGGVALMAAAFAVKMGTEVWVTSGEVGKIQRAVEMLGVAGGVCYKDKGWEKEVLGKMRELNRKRDAGGEEGELWFDAILDGAGGDIVEKGAKILKTGGVISMYGMTLGPKVPFTMQAVLKNIELRGSTMGSRAEFRDMLAFVREKQIRPVISRTVHVPGLTGDQSLDAIDSLFEDMKENKQFGKLVVEIARENDEDETEKSKL